MTIYRSKISLAIVIPLFLLLGGISVEMIYEQVWLVFIVIFSAFAFSMHMILTTYYVIEGQTLLIRSGFLYNRKLDISTIRKITETNNPLSSPAASLDRLEIKYNKFDWVLVSPKNKKGFIEDLRSINPNIEVVYRK